MTTPQDRGREFERTFAKLFGVEPQRGSGNQWTAKLDVADGSILWSLKHTDKQSFSLTKALMREAQEAVTGQGGVGGETIPGLAIRIDNESFVVLRGEDFMRMAEEEVEYIRPSKGEAKRQRSRVPNLLREEEND